MSERMQLLAQQIFGRPSVESCTLEEIRDLTQRYPYHAAAQFLLLEKLRLSGAPEYEAQLQRAVLYYHNPLEFEYFISSAHFQTTFADLPVPVQEETVEEHQPIAEEAFGLQEDEQPPSLPPVEEQPAVQAAVAIETPALEEKEPEAEPVLSFEPYHTVDYFASQGIKLSQDEAPKDRFGKQLKSFTEWLRTMKRLPATELAPAAEAPAEAKVQHLAEDSVHVSDVVTEAMAEVWEKQGNKEKALEVYKKLSLHNPSKKAYFAAKIENLKRST
ncbi:MAG TPA: hypothetical protein VFR58_10380 [Flavisolibacter sp.]|nr:hypothetical protein [Flavisolibacter sp.]